MNRFHHVRIKLESFLNNLSLKKKLRYLYFLCILVPIFLTDIVILHALTKNEHAEQLHQMEKIAKSVQSMLSAATEDSALISTSLYMDNSLQDFVSRQYASPRDYFSSYREYIHNSLLQGVSRITNSVIRVYADNETLINGSEFAWLSTVSQEPWYQQYTADGYSPRLLFSYDETDGRQEGERAQDARPSRHGRTCWRPERPWWAWRRPGRSLWRTQIGGNGFNPGRGEHGRAFFKERAGSAAIPCAG